MRNVVTVEVPQISTLYVDVSGYVAFVLE